MTVVFSFGAAIDVAMQELSGVRSHEAENVRYRVTRTGGSTVEIRRDDGLVAAGRIDDGRIRFFFPETQK
jgi:hypothetical protein